MQSVSWKRCSRVMLTEIEIIRLSSPRPKEEDKTMTQERTQKVTGFIQVGDEESLRGVGVLFGYPVEAGFSKNEKELALAFTADQAGFKIKDLRKRLQENPELKGKVAGLEPPAGEMPMNVFLITIDAANDTEMEHLYHLTIKVLEEALTELPVFTPPTTCKICGGIDSDTVAIVENALNYVHKACLERHQQEVQQALEEKELNPKTIEGFLGGLIGGAVGAIPALIALVLFNYFIGVLFALIPLGIFYGWKLLGGKLIVLTRIFTIVYTIFMSFFVWILFLAIYVRNSFAYYDGIEITLGESINFVFENISAHPEFLWEHALTDILFAFGSAIVGIWMVWRFISRTDASVLAQVQAALNEAVPLELVKPVEVETVEQVGTFLAEENQQIEEQEIEDNAPSGF